MVLIRESNFNLSCSRTHNVFLVLVVFQDPLKTDGTLSLSPLGTWRVCSVFGNPKPSHRRSRPAVETSGLHPPLRDLTARSLQLSAALFPKRPDFKASTSAPVSPNLPWPSTPIHSAPDSTRGTPRAAAPQPPGPCVASGPGLPWDPGRQGIQLAPGGRARSAPACPREAGRAAAPRSQSSSGVPEGPPGSRSLLPASQECRASLGAPRGHPAALEATRRHPQGSPGFWGGPGPPHRRLFSTTPSRASLPLVTSRTPGPSLRLIPRAVRGPGPAAAPASSPCTCAETRPGPWPRRRLQCAPPPHCSAPVTIATHAVALTLKNTPRSICHYPRAPPNSFGGKFLTAVSPSGHSPNHPRQGFLLPPRVEWLVAMLIHF